MYEAITIRGRPYRAAGENTDRPVGLIKGKKRKNVTVKTYSFLSIVNESRVFKSPARRYDAPAQRETVRRPRASHADCSSEHPSYPASNLLQHRSNSSWRCAKPGEMLATVTFELAEQSCITGLDVGNYRSCVVIVTASTVSKPDTWVPIVNHQFLTNDEAANSKFRDQVQIFTKKDLNPDTIKIKFDRVKVTCMQSANLKELFGLSFIELKTEVVVDMKLNIFGRFKLKNPEEDDSIDGFKEKNMRIIEAGKTEEVFGSKNKDPSNTATMNDTKCKNEKASNDKPVARTPFGDIVPSTTLKVNKTNTQKNDTYSRKRSLSPKQSSSKQSTSNNSKDCSQCQDENKICNNCKKLPKPKPTIIPERPAKKRKKLFSKLFEDMSFSLSGYVNPQRDEIRKKALQMGARYIADPNTTNKKCTYLICAFTNTPKYQQLKGHSKIVSHTFIENCFNEKTRFPWRRYALDKEDATQPESEEEILGSSSPFNSFEEDTDLESN
ncbi:DNA repair protein XRCC1 [Melipona quadrifasciata]|uniref:DNA repair protein XRCC1 n=1 Tax=Melipona quadrifasciata TaxID=166423 RepID=A0A0M8ZQH8_9HYME|nr:DNA repair protein XRCC1 [Melipona quadrifasciata]